MPKDPATSENAEDGVFAYVQAYAARSGPMSGSVDEAWTGSWGHRRRWAPGSGRPRVSATRCPQAPHRASVNGSAPRLAMPGDAVHLLNLLG
ncbi:hypothetical protein SAMN05444921_14015 [Streptomyces wuyuanensis]|uniref:Uncharacterized protein n=1 Tax=Streptomyces wuyuanensis TaxID=1196353 RepID=A0A1H0E684_9ACTN|nr:hypothetical protein SAMN05444921_14015 [Streptomyces wuyuanensis]